MKKWVFFFITLLILSSPWIAYALKPSMVLSISILDVTSNDNKVREREGFYNVLQMNKIIDEEKQMYDAKNQYYGVDVNDYKKLVTFHEMPTRLDTYDVVYLMNAQGIEQRSISWNEENTDHILYGGITKTMWRTIETRLAMSKATTFIGQAVFEPSTEQVIQMQIEQKLGVKYSGWRAKYYKNLKEALFLDEEHSGAGLVLHNDLTNTFEVISLQQPVTIQPTSEGQHIVPKQTIPFEHWFELSEATEATILANFQLELSDAQKQMFQELNIPISPVATTQVKEGEATSYYIASNFSTREKLSQNKPYIGYKFLNRLFSKKDAIYWHVYEPMMKTLLAEAQHENVSIKPVDVSPQTNNNIRYNTRVFGDSFEVYQNGRWQPLTIKGMNMGMAKPGVFPGEAGISRDDYDDWFQSIGELGANTVRIYTIHPPEFYEALLAYNETHEQPIYVFHGVWIDEESLVERLDVYGSPTDIFQDEIQDVVDIIHGNAVIEPKVGHASGTFSADISQYVIGWIIGVEWFQEVVLGTNEKHKNKPQFEGTYFQTKDASPFEIWLAEQLEFVASYEILNYKWMRPYSFTNWVTTDLLDHPYEVYPETEDLVVVDPNNIYTTNEVEGVGQFASYHVYPYYPESLNFDENYLKYVDFRGNTNSYAAYLNDLHRAHRLPVLVAEFGIPSSRGLTHTNPYGWNQGFVSEEEQGDIIVSLYEDILYEGLLGGLVFTWQDEWFKRTWNTLDLDNPNERPYWSNAQTSEQNFGIVGFEKLEKFVDGDSTDWFGQMPIHQSEDLRLYLDTDERYVYFRLDVLDTNFSTMYYPIISIDTIQGQGNDMYQNINLRHEADYVITLKGDDDSRIEVDAYYDIFHYIYGYVLDMVKNEGLTEKNSGQFNAIDLALNKQFTVPITNEFHPFSKYETGKLRRGDGNPDHVDFDSLADFEINVDEGIVEIRIPWQLLNFTDPSNLEVRADLYGEEVLSYENIEGISVGVTLIKNGQIIARLPEDEKFKLFKWSSWELPNYKMRLKESYYILQKKFNEVQ